MKKLFAILNRTADRLTSFGLWISIICLLTLCTLVTAAVSGYC
jgi:hypothetical protein